MVWRAYYTLKDAANELSREFNDTYTPADLVHYGAIGLVDLCFNDLNKKYFFIERFDSEFNGGDEKSTFVQSFLAGVFAVIPTQFLRSLEQKENEDCALSYIERLKSPDGDDIYPKVPEKHLGLIQSALETFGGNSPTDYWKFYALPRDPFSGLLNTLGEIKDDSFYDIKNIPTFTTESLYLTNDDFILLKQRLQEKLNLSRKQTSAKTANKQAEIITALAMMFTKTDCSRPYEAAETILQEWQRQETTLGKPPSKETLAQYIADGLERIKT